MSSFGHWICDEARLPAFAFSSDSKDPYFLLGNHRLTVFAHVDGRLQMLTGERSWMRLNHVAGFSGGHEAKVAVDGVEQVLTGGAQDVWSQGRREFGCGFALYETLGNSLRCRRTFAVAPDKELADALPAIVACIELTNEGTTAKSIRYTELFRASPRMLRHQWLDDGTLPIRYQPQGQNSQGDRLRISFASDLDDPHAACSRDRPAFVDAFPPGLAMLARNASVSLGDDGWITIKTAAEIPAGGRLSLSWAVAVEFPIDGEVITDRLATILDEAALEKTPFRRSWSRRLPSFPDEADRLMAREMVWHAYMLEAMAVHSSYYGETFIPQGTNYDYSYAFTAAPRDHLQHALGVMHSHPALAKSAIRFVLQKVDAKGEIVYTDCGVGMTSNGIWHTSDQQLYLFYVVGEYLRITKDHAFLAELVAVHPIELGCRRTVFEQIERSFGYLRDEVGVGLHGLPRILNSDWNDGIFYNRPLRYGEFLASSSHANGAMVAALLPPLAQQLEAGRAYITSPNLDALLVSIARYRGQVTEAMLADLRGRTFSRRAYLGDGTVLGEDNVYLEPQPWLLMLPEFDRKTELMREIHERLNTGEVLGSRCIQHPVPGSGEAPPGEAENAAFWYALQGQLIAAVARLDATAATDLLRRMSMHNFASTYPDIWYGHWSGSDTCNSSLAERPGRMTSLDPRREITPIPCAHAHAYALYAYQIVREVRRAHQAQESGS